MCPQSFSFVISGWLQLTAAGSQVFSLQYHMQQKSLLSCSLLGGKPLDQVAAVRSLSWSVVVASKPRSEGCVKTHSELF